MDTVVLSSSADGTTILWDLALRSVISLYKDNVPLLRATAAVGACVTPSGNCRLDYILAAQAGKPAINIYTWNKDTPLYRCAISETPTCISTSSDGTLCCIGTSSGKFIIWDIPTGELLRIHQAHFKAITCICISACGSYIVTGGQDAVLHVWDTQHCIDIYHASSSFTTSSNDVSSSSNHNDSTHCKPIFTYTGHTLPLTQVYFLPGNIDYGMNNGGNKQGLIRRILTASLDRTVRLIDIPSQLCLLVAKFPIAISTLTVNNYANTQSSNQHNHEMIYAGCVDGNIYSLDTLSAIGNYLGTHNNTNTTNSNSLSSSTSSLSTSTTAVNTSSSTLFSRSSLSSSSSSSSSLPVTTVSADHSSMFIGHTATVTTLSLTPDGTYLVSGGDDGIVRIWDIISHQCIHTFHEHHTSPIFTLLVIPRPPHLALTGKHALLPLLPLGPFRKHLSTIPLDYKGSTLGPLTKDRNRTVRIYSHMNNQPSSGMTEFGHNPDTDTEFHENIMILQTLYEQESLGPHRNNNNNNGTTVASTYKESSGTQVSSDPMIQELQARIATLENENTRWKDVNNKLVTQLKTLQQKK